MRTDHLRVLSPAQLADQINAPATVGARIRRLQAEAKSLAHEHVSAFASAMKELETLAAEIADGGEAYPAGIRDLARRMADDLEAKAQTVQAIAARH